MKTAQELILESEYWMSDPGETENLMIEFAKMHVEAALKSVVEKSNYTYDKNYGGQRSFADKEEILNAYPLEKIE